MPRKTSPDPVYRLKIVLAHSKPPIWRRVEVPGKTFLGELHRIIQGVMNWEESHMHEFVFGSGKRPGREDVLAGSRSGAESVNELRHERQFSDPLFELEEAGDEWQMTLAEAAPAAKTKFRYVYDFGDGWEHLVTVEKISPAAEGANYPRCIGGARRAPMEDSGAIWGWEEKVNLVNQPPEDPEDEEYEDIRSWMGLEPGETFDAEFFDVGEANARMVRTMKMIDSGRKAEIRRRSRAR